MSNVIAYMLADANFYYFTCLRSSRFDADANGSWITYGGHGWRGDVDIKKRELLHSKTWTLKSIKTRILIKFCCEKDSSLHPNCFQGPFQHWKLMIREWLIEKSQLLRRKEQKLKTRIKTNFQCLKIAKWKRTILQPLQESCVVHLQVM